MHLMPWLGEKAHVSEGLWRMHAIWELSADVQKAFFHLVDPISSSVESHQKAASQPSTVRTEMFYVVGWGGNTEDGLIASVLVPFSLIQILYTFKKENSSEPIFYYWFCWRECKGFIELRNLTWWFSFTFIKIIMIVPLKPIMKSVTC